MTRLSSDAFCEGKNLSKDDYVIICGDFGYWQDTSSERYNLDWLDAKPWTTLFIDGNHENFDRLNRLPRDIWHGGNVHWVRKSVIHLMRGQIFTLENRKFFTFGGASSHDIADGILEKDDKRIKSWSKNPNKMFRINHVSWWNEEMPTQEEKDEGLYNLSRLNYEVDYIITHSPYSSILKFMNSMYKTDSLTEYLEYVKNNVQYKQWFFGHMHKNENFYFDKSTCIYEQIVRIL